MEGKLYENTKTGALYECVAAYSEYAELKLVAGSYDGNDPRQEFVIFSVNTDWELASKNKIHQEILRCGQTITDWLSVADKIRQTESYLYMKLSELENNA